MMTCSNSAAMRCSCSTRCWIAAKCPRARVSTFPHDMRGSSFSLSKLHDFRTGTTADEQRKQAGEDHHDRYRLPSKASRKF